MENEKSGETVGMPPSVSLKRISTSSKADQHVRQDFASLLFRRKSSATWMGGGTPFHRNERGNGQLEKLKVALWWRGPRR